MRLLVDFRPMRRAFTLLELLCAVAIVAILLALLLPVLERGFAHARRTSCLNNLRNVGVAFSAWAHDHGDLLPMQVSTSHGGTREFAEAAVLNPNVSFTFRHFQAISNELSVAKVLRCPADKQRIAAGDFVSLANTNVSYWVNVGAVFGNTDSPIAGDRNIRTSGRTEWTYVQIAPGDAVEFSAELHGHRGNVLFADGHVALLDSTLLGQMLAGGGRTNGGDTTLSLPRQDVDGSGSVASDPSSLVLNNSGSTVLGATSGNDRNDSRASAQREQQSTQNPLNSNANASTISAPNARGSGGTRAPGEGQPLVYTLLDGTVVTSAAPRKVTNAIADSPGSRGEVMMQENPLLEFAAWLTRQATRYTYWLLLLLLAALVAFELARRRAQNKRRRRVLE